jgi:hypothetical protein
MVPNAACVAVVGDPRAFWELFLAVGAWLVPAQQLLATDDVGRQQRAQWRFSVANPSLAFCPIMIAAACGAPGQRQRLGQRHKSIDISLYSGWDELTSTLTRDHDLESIGNLLMLPPQGGWTEKLKEKLTKNFKFAVFRLRRSITNHYPTDANYIPTLRVTAYLRVPAWSAFDRRA